MLVLSVSAMSWIVCSIGWFYIKRDSRRPDMNSTSDFYRKVGERIRAKRQERGLSQESLAIAIGLRSNVGCELFSSAVCKASGVGYKALPHRSRAA
jgi:hypothetical protein